jgi:hypothetical protein
MVMVCIQVLSEDGAIAFAGSQGNFELNAMRPIIINNFLHSATILGDACTKLREYCIEGTELNRERIDTFVNESLMLVTALSPVIGYDRASAIGTGRTTRVRPFGKQPWHADTSAVVSSTGSSTRPAWWAVSAWPRARRADTTRRPERCCRWP